MSATPIPRTMMMSLYGDMDISKIKTKNHLKKKIITLSKPENKINELWSFIKKQIRFKSQIFLGLSSNKRFFFFRLLIC